jgi:thioredoxin-like negative regulator of GroEL
VTKAKPTVVVLSADWCSPCKSLKKQLDKAEIPYEVADIDTPKGSKLADKLGVQGVPEVFLKRGRKYEVVRDATARRIRLALEADDG